MQDGSSLVMVACVCMWESGFCEKHAVELAELDHYLMIIIAAAVRLAWRTCRVGS